MTYQIVYLSEATNTEDIDQQIEDILEKSIKNNSRSSITGCLIYNSGYFLQLLEGPKEKVEQTLLRIENDKRHRSVSLIVSQDAIRPIFKHWSMASTRLDNSEIELIDEVITWRNIIKSSKSNYVNPRELFKLLQSFSNRLKLTKKVS